jgi:hypothetical protein
MLTISLQPITLCGLRWKSNVPSFLTIFNWHKINISILSTRYYVPTNCISLTHYRLPYRSYQPLVSSYLFSLIAHFYYEQRAQEIWNEYWLYLYVCFHYDSLNVCGNGWFILKILYGTLSEIYTFVYKCIYIDPERRSVLFWCCHFALHDVLTDKCVLRKVGPDIFTSLMFHYFELCNCTGLSGLRV